MTLEVVPQMEVDRTLPHAELDGTDMDARLNRYREQVVANSMQAKTVLADEGSFFTCNNAQTGINTAAAPVAFSATNPFLILYNTAAPSDDFALRVYIDYLMLLATAPGTGGTSLQFAMTWDRGNRYASGGTDLTPNITRVNNAVSRNSGLRIFAGNLTASAASTNAKTLIGNRWLKGAIPVIGDQYNLRFGTTDVPDILSISTILFSNHNLPPFILGPDESILLHIWLPAQSAASSYIPEITWWER